MEGFTAEFVNSLIGGTLVVYHTDERKKVIELTRGKITEASVVPVSDSETRVEIKTEVDDTGYYGKLELLYDLSVMDAAVFFSSRYFDDHFIIAPPGTEISSIG